MKTINELIQKYNRPGPRYTSYPPVPFWKNAPNEEQWLSHLKEKYDLNTGVDLYVHIPYCEKLCYYCGCNRTITKNHGVEFSFVASLIKEWSLYQEKLGFPVKVNSLHFGGGTPTFLSPENLDNLIQNLLKNKTSNFIGSIEVDPRTCKDGHIDVLAQNGIKRVSLGIQDFDPVVQKAVNRMQSVELVETLIQKLRNAEISSLNFDLIYGLPKQTVKSVTDTIETVVKLRPDLIAFYSYAHLPERIKNQRLIVESDLPSAELKKELYETGKALLMDKGYIDIGMDHFALPTSFLYQARENKTLQRNFMGYVDKKSPQLIGLGPTSISDSSISFAQNTKDVNLYSKRVMEGHLPIEIGHTHNHEDLLIQNIIMQLMCHNEVEIKNPEKLKYWKDISSEMQSFKDDGIIGLEHDKITITPTGKGFVRNVAMSFDNNLREQTAKVKFSQTI